MKGILRVTLALIVMCLLVGCATTQCHSFPCWQTYINLSRCGKCVMDKCRPACDACVFSGPACKACFACVNYNECKYNYCAYSNP